ncbi:MAG: hypothetical protein PHD09_03850 [Candidatus Omnitrophica bacterium]|nr:hypothetical protein [Candidatus Omnitrophota bacterium]
MPPSSKYAFQLTIDGARAVADAKKWRAQIQKQLAAPMAGTVPTATRTGTGTGTASGQRKQQRQQADDLHRLQNQINQTRSASDLLTRSLQIAGAAGFAYLAKEAGEAVWAMGKAGAESLRTKESFGELAAEVDETGSSLTKKMRTASNNTIDDMTLMRVTAGLLASGIKTSTADIETALELARLKARQFSISTSEAYERMVTGARKFSVEMLDEIGVNLKAESVYRRRAEALGVAKDQLTDNQKAEALWLAILEDGRAELAKHGPIVEDYADKIARAETAMQNASLAAKEAFAPAIAGIGEAIAEIIPDLVEAVDYLSILANAGIEWAVAGFEGRDAQAAFNATVMEGVGGAGEAARAALYLADAELKAARSAREAADARVLAELRAENFVAAEYELAVAAQREAQARESAALIAQAKAQADYDAATATGQAADATDELAGALMSVDPIMQKVMDWELGLTKAAQGLTLSTWELTNALQAAAGLRVAGKADILDIGTKAADSAMFQSVLGMGVSPEKAMTMHDQYLAGLEQVLAGAQGLTEREIEFRVAAYKAGWQEILNDTRDAYREQGKVATDAARKAEQAQQAFRSAVAGMFAPTDVTDLDMAQSGAGVYRDKWDEYARRVRAAMTDMQSEFRGMIPTDIELAGEGAIQEWGQRQLDAFYAGLMPDQVNWDAFAADFSRKIAEQVGKENLIDRAIQELAARGITAGRADVQQALGLTSQLETLVFGGLSPEDAGTQLSASIGTALSNVKIDPAAIDVAAGGGLAAQLFAGVTGEQVMEPVLAGLSQMQLDAGQLDAPGNQIARGLFDGFQVHISEYPWTQIATASIIRDIQNNEWMLIQAGKMIGKPLWDGLLSMVRGSGIVNHIVAEVLSALADSL